MEDCLGLMKKIVIYHPDDDLMDKIKRLPKDEFQIIGTVEANIEDINYDGYDYICIPFSNYKEIKSKLNKLVGSSVVHTYEELRVLGSEKRVNEHYAQKWKQSHAAGINKFENKSVIIFGGGSGIGYACAEAFVLSGARVIIAGRNEDKLKTAADNLESTAKYILWDISKVGQNYEKLGKVLELADGQIDIVVNSAGVYDTDSVSFFDVTEEMYDTVMETNLKGSYFLCRTFADYFMCKGIRGHIINVVSETGNSPTVKPYGMSKWGLWGLTWGLGLNLAKYGITVNGVAPGEVATEMTGWGKAKGREPARRAPQTGRVLFSREVAETILFLAGKAGENMPGEVMLYNGGSVGGYIGFSY